MRIRKVFARLRQKFIPEPIWRHLTWLHFLRENTEKVIGPLTYNQDGLATRHNCDFIKEERFARAYKAGEETGSWGGATIHWRAFIACWAAQKGMSIEGDFVECGVNRGGLARTVLEYTALHQTSRKFYLLDTFNGLVERYITAEEKALGRRAGGHEECFDAVKITFSDYPNTVIIKGAIPETLSKVSASKIAYLSIDMNCTEPEIAAAEYFWDRLSSGAVMLLDDYGWGGHIMQKKAFDQFAVERGVLILALPTGQGLIIKP
jgi:O-methyltransferase